MDGNKDEAARCLRLAKLALAAGDKPRAVKLLRFARRLDPSLPLPLPLPTGASFTGDQSTLIHNILTHTDYYAVLGVSRTSTADDIRRAYRKLSLKVHPDKTSVPGAEDAFKALSTAFACLSSPDSRRAYDRAALINDEARVRHRRRTAPDEVYATSFHEYYTVRRPRRDGPIGLGFVLLLYAAIILIIAVLANAPTEQEYSIRKTHRYGVRRVTGEYEVEYFVKSEEFDMKYPPGSSERDDFEGGVLRSYKNILWQRCYREMRRHRRGRVFPTPHCDKLRSIQAA